jgi:hypothetical protein
MARASTLTSLPNELLDAICARLTRSARCALALACKATKPSATAALYKVYTNRSAPWDAPFHLFLRTICEKPEYGVLVKEVDIRGWRSEQEVATHSEWRPTVTRPIEEDELPVRTGPQFTSTERGLKNLSVRAADNFKLFLDTAINLGLVAVPASTDHIPALKSKAIMGTTLKADADFIRQLKHGVEDAHFILLIAQLPKLEKLLVDGLTPYPILDWHHFFSRVPTALQSIKILNLWGSRVSSDDKPVITTLQIIDLLHNLELLQLVNMSARKHQHSGQDVLVSRKLLRVSFPESAVSHRLLRKVVNGQRLESFLYTPGYLPFQVNPSAAFSEQQVLSYLDSSTSSLKTLILHPLNDYGHSSRFKSMTERLKLKHTDIQRYKTLEHLDMPFPGLLPWFEVSGGAGDIDTEMIEDQLRERLPASLKKLVLNRLFHTGQVEAILLVLAILKANKDLPLLQNIIVKFAPPVAMTMVGMRPRTLTQIQASIEEGVSDSFAKANMTLEFEESS